MAAGGGRHARFFLARGNRVVAVDRRVDALRTWTAEPRARVVQADLEASGWPFKPGVFGGVIVVHYLWRPLFPALSAALAPGGALIYETFAVGNERYGRPSNPDYLLREGELLEGFADLKTVEYEHRTVREPNPAVVQRLCAIRPAGPGPRSPRRESLR